MVCSSHSDTRLKETEQHTKREKGPGRVLGKCSVSVVFVTLGQQHYFGANAHLKFPSRLLHRSCRYLEQRFVLVQSFLM